MDELPEDWNFLEYQTTESMTSADYTFFRKLLISMDLDNKMMVRGIWDNDLYCPSGGNVAALSWEDVPADLRRFANLVCMSHSRPIGISIRDAVQSFGLAMVDYYGLKRTSIIFAVADLWNGLVDAQLSYSRDGRPIADALRTNFFDPTLMQPIVDPYVTTERIDSEMLAMKSFVSSGDVSTHSGYTTKELCDEVGLKSTKPITDAARVAGIRRPGTGGHGYRYPINDLPFLARERISMARSKSEKQKWQELLDRHNLKVAENGFKPKAKPKQRD